MIDNKYVAISEQIKLIFALAGQVDVDLLKEAVNDLQRDAAHYAACGFIDNNLDYYKKVNDKKAKYVRARKLLEFIETLHDTNDKIIGDEYNALKI